MNKYFSILLLCSGITLYAQNPSEKKLALANKLYAALMPDEQAYCDLMYRDLAIHHARQLYVYDKEQLIPRVINPEEDLILASKKAALKQKLNLSDSQGLIIGNISLTRMTALWKNQAVLVGRTTTWPFTYEDQAEDLHYLLTKDSENELFS